MFDTVRSQSHRPRRARALVKFGAAALAASALLAACGSDDPTAPAGGTAAAGSLDKATTVRLGYFPNFTHAPAIVGVEKGHFQQALGDVTLKTTTFNAGPAAVEALFSDAIDATFIGPNPTITAFAQSKGQAVRVIAGAAANGAYLVVKPEISTPADLRGTKLSTPQLGNTQDVALRYWLTEQGLDSDAQGGGDVSILPQENAQSLTAFAAGQIDGAWVPEPWATRLVDEAGGKILVDERDLWPDRQFVTTQLIVRAEFLEENPGIVEELLDGELAALDEIEKDPAGAQATVNSGIEKLTGKPINAGVLAKAWGNVIFTADPIASSLRESATHAEAVGLLDKVDLTALYDLGPLNKALAAAGKKEVSDS